MNIDWGKIFTSLIAEVVKLLLPKAKGLLEWAIEEGYRIAEEWAKKFDKDAKPASVEKMAKAVAVATSIVPTVEPAVARMLLEAKHLEVTHK